MRKRARVDNNQAEIVKGLRDRGCSVLHLHQLGKGAPDLLIGHNGVNLLVELKDGTKPPSQQKLTPDEVAFHSQWRGQVAVVSNLEDAIALLKGDNKNTR